MLRFIRSANGMGIIATVLMSVWMMSYFLGTNSWNPLGGKLGIFTIENFARLFSIVAPTYIAFEAITSAFSLSSNAGSSTGRVAGLINLGTTVAFFALAFALYLKSNEWGVDPAKVSQIGNFLYVSVLDMIVSGGIALLVSLGMRTFGTNPAP